MQSLALIPFAPGWFYSPALHVALPPARYMSSVTLHNSCDDKSTRPRNTWLPTGILTSDLKRVVNPWSGHCPHYYIETFFEIPTITARPSNFGITLLPYPVSPAKPPSPRTTNIRVLDNEKYARQAHIWTDPRSVARSGAQNRRSTPLRGVTSGNLVRILWGWAWSNAYKGLRGRL